MGQQTTKNFAYEFRDAILRDEPRELCGKMPCVLSVNATLSIVFVITHETFA